MELRQAKERCLQFDSAHERGHADPADPCGKRGMIGPGTGVRVYLACGTTDMRKG